MYKKIKNSSFMNWLWFIMYLLPFIIFGVMFFKYCNFFNYEVLESNSNINNPYVIGEYFESFSQNVFNAIDNLITDWRQNSLWHTFNDILSYFIEDDTTMYLVHFISFIFTYWVIITLVHLAFDFLMLLPNICHKFMEKVGGERD